MSMGTIGVEVTGGNAAESVEQIQRLEELGVKAAWTTSGGDTDPITLLAVAAMHTESILLGTSIVPTWPRHPITAAQQTNVIAHSAPGRFRLGIGPSHYSEMYEPFRFDFRKPLTNLREYLRIVKPLVQQGAVDFDGEMYHAHVSASDSFPDLPIMASALRPKSFRLCGEEADGAISWVCPLAYLRDSALPAMKEGAQAAARPTPPLIAHAVVSVHENYDEVKEAALEEMAYYPTAPFYQQMFALAGYPEAEKLNGWSDRMLQEIVISGPEENVAPRLQQFFDAGAGEVLVSIIPAGPDKPASWERSAKLLASF